jgi:hypothetical protein
MACRSLFATIALAGLFVADAAGAQDFLLKYPNIVGQWRRPPGIGIQWDQSKRVGPAQQAPLTPEYQARYEANLADQRAGGQGTDPLGKCIPPGMPRMMSVIFPMEIIIMPNTTYILTDYTDPRRIFTDGRAWPKEIEPTFNGYSIGKWIDEDGDGKFDVLEAETRTFSGPRAFDLSGIPLHEDNETVIKERIYLDKADKNLLHDEITVTDHALTRPWTVKKSYRRSAQARPEWPEYMCVERSETMRIGNETYLVNKEGYLLPSKKGQKPPSVQHFPVAER